MKKLSQFVLIAIFGISISQAQITITQADFPAIVTTKIVLTDSTDGLSGITPGNSGANQTWDFSSYTMGNTQTGTIDYSQNITNPEFSNANISNCNNNGTFEFCVFYDLNSSGLYQMGSVFEIVMPPPAFMRGIVKYTPHAPEYIFPLTYNSNYSSNYVQSQLNTSNPPQNGNDSTLTLAHKTKLVEADGWGTLITPLGTYNALRLKITETEIDTQWVHTPGVGWSVNYANSLSGPFTHYEWVSNVNRIVVARLRVGQQTGTWRFSFLHDTTSVSPQIPNAPSNLTAVSTNKRSTGSIELNWQDNSNNEDGFYIESTNDTISGTWSLLATVSTDVSTYDHTGLNDGEQYFYRVSAFNSVGSSAFSNVAETTVSVNTNNQIFDKNNISIYPNPANTTLTLQFDNLTNHAVAEIYDITGKSIKTVSLNTLQTTIGVAELNTGIYFIKVSYDKGFIVQKFVKE